MNRFSKLVLAAAIALACASCVAFLDQPIFDQRPVVQFEQLRPDPREPVAYGPLSIEYRLTVFNSTSQRVVLRAIDLRSAGMGAYTFARQSRRLHLSIAPGEALSTNIFIDAWGNGSQASAYEPVTIEGTAWFAMAHSRRSPVTFELTP